MDNLHTSTSSKVTRNIFRIVLFVILSGITLISLQMLGSYFLHARQSAHWTAVWSTIESAQLTGDYSLCKNVGDMKAYCIAQTELQQGVLLNYKCTTESGCGAPECYLYMDCGSGGGSSGGCPAQDYCVVDQTWICEQTGGTVDIPSRESVSNAAYYEGWVDVAKKAGRCSCPANTTFIKSYGCTDCNSFTHVETQEYCKTAGKSSGGPDFKKAY